MVIQVDSREKRHIIRPIIEAFENSDVDYFISKLPVGDYMSIDNPKLVVDRKQNLAEIAKNFTEKRFIDEMIRAKKYGIKIIFLVEHGGQIKSITDVEAWKNPRLATSPMALSGPRIFRKMLAFQNYYGVEFAFCSKEETGVRIIELLRG